MVDTNVNRSFWYRAVVAWEEVCEEESFEAAEVDEDVLQALQRLTLVSRVVHGRVEVLPKQSRVDIFRTAFCLHHFLLQDNSLEVIPGQNLLFVNQEYHSWLRDNASRFGKWVYSSDDTIRQAAQFLVNLGLAEFIYERDQMYLVATGLYYWLVAELQDRLSVVELVKRLAIEDSSFEYVLISNPLVRGLTKGSGLVECHDEAVCVAAPGLRDYLRQPEQWRLETLLFMQRLIAGYMKPALRQAMGMVTAFAVLDFLGLSGDIEPRRLREAKLTARNATISLMITIGRKPEI